MPHHYPTPVLALITALLPFGLVACQSGENPNDSSSTAQVEENDPMEFPSPPSTFDPSKIEKDGAKSVDGQVVKDIKRFTLPIDPYIVESTGSDIKAQQVFLDKCLKSKNVSVNFPDIDFNPNKPKDPKFAVSSGQFLFTPENASKYGYFSAYSDASYDKIPAFYNEIERIHKIAEKEVPIEGEENSFTVETVSEKANDPTYKALIECEEQFSNEFMDPSFNSPENEDEQENEYSFEKELKRNPTQAMFFFSDAEPPILKDTITKWKECMKPLGIPDLPDTPFEMPTQSLSDKWYDKPDETTTFPPPPADELVIAKQDAECRQSSGFYQTYYDVQWGLLQDYVKENKDAIQKTKQREEAAEKKRQEFILQNQ
ncbi:hypothetical protein [Stomatohabitans albus]|uniref:hypothetical protein n=1 Tax=Stomatohabitans albus TaxID=3110766 RepID=UPI00300D221B